MEYKIREKSAKIQTFILLNVNKHPKDIVKLTSKKFDISRSAVLRHVKTLIQKKLVSVKGNTKNREYSLIPISEKSKLYKITKNLKEDVIWREICTPILGDLKKNVYEICMYGFTEIVNNAIDHSEGQNIYVNVSYTFSTVEIYIKDDGVGIFRKIRDKLSLENDLHAILELAKGKLTTDPEKHTGEGIFFTSRSFDSFSLISKDVHFNHLPSGLDFGAEIKRDDNLKWGGTTVFMEIGRFSSKSLQKIFEKFTSKSDFGFSKTIVPVFLAQYGEENLISRSQAKRLLARFDKFKEVILDFKNVNNIGQAFADEIFRVFVNKHPDIYLNHTNTNNQVRKMIEKVKANNI